MTIDKQDVIDTHIRVYYEDKLKDISTLLHEDIAQKMYAVFNHLQYVQQPLNNRQDRTANEEMIKLTKKTIEDLRFQSQDVLPFFQKGINGALESFLINYSRNLGIIAQMHSYGEKQQLPQIVELIIYRSFKDLLNALAGVFTLNSVEVTTTCENTFEMKIKYEIAKQTFERFKIFSSDIKKTEKQLQIVGGSINEININKKNGQICISIPNVR